MKVFINLDFMRFCSFGVLRAVVLSYWFHLTNTAKLIPAVCLKSCHRGLSITGFPYPLNQYNQ